MQAMFGKLQANPALSLYEVLDNRALCRLFLDLEYDRVANADRTADCDAAAVTCLLEHARAVLSDRGMVCDDASVWVLDASDDCKFSQHVIVGVVGQRYVGPVGMVGAIVTELVSKAVAAKPELFLVHKRGDQPQASLVDLSVYNTNQQFRVAYSSKYGQHRPLLPANRQQHVVLSHCTWSMFESTLIVCGRSPTAPTIQPVASVSAQLQPIVRPAVACYPALEAQISKCLLFGQLKEAKVHRKHPLAVPCLYWSTTSRYCPGIGREHASNHMQVVVNVALCAWRFHCLDPDCQPGPWKAFDASLLQLHPAAAHLQEWHQHWEKHRVISQN